MIKAEEPCSLEQLQTWVGREETATDCVSVDLARKFHATLGLPGAAPDVGEAAPHLIHFCLGPAIVPTLGLGDDGHPPRGGFLPPIPLPRRMWAGSELNFHQPLRVGDTVQRKSTIANVVAKEGRSGPLYFVTVKHALFEEQVRVLDELQSIVYRGGGESGSPSAAAPADSGAIRRHLEASSILLFRYSSLTFNGHRIHYDRRYAMEVEHYPGLVVHGPLLATLMLHLAAEFRGGVQPSKFMFQSVSPLFDEDRIFMHARPNGVDKLTLWTARENGPVATVAEACWR